MASQTQAQSPRLFVPGMSGLYDSLSPYMVPLVRFAVGIMLAPHGAQKLFGWFGAPPEQFYLGFFDKLGLHPPGTWQIIIGLIEFVGGLGLALGLFTRIAAAAIFLEMAYIVFFINWANGYFWTPKAGIEYPMMWGIVAFAFFILGGGRLSIDKAIGKEF
jgi:putative oxidoreductase